MEPIFSIIFSLLVLLFSVVIHEVSHGLAALSLGDVTAKYEGRLTLNPLKHLDFFGSFLLPLLLLVFTFGKGPLFGWAKPVPINPYNFRDQKWGALKVALAGPLSNIILAVFFGLIIRFLPMTPVFFDLFSMIVLLNLVLAFFNLIPIPPLDGSHILFSLLPEKFNYFKLQLSQFGFLILVLLIFSGAINFVFKFAQFVYLWLVGF
jgi:Zn-dependent protease